MANKRILKNQIRRVCGDIASQCIFAAELIPGVDADAMGGIICSLAALQEKTVADVNFSFDHKPTDFPDRAAYRKALNAYNRKAYASLKQKFNTAINDIVGRMNALLPQEQKELNKLIASGKAE